MEEADAKGIDNVRQTWTAVRRVIAAKYFSREIHPLFADLGNKLRTPIGGIQDYKLPENREMAPIASS